ncbi:lysophospholipid acyltransferase family protein [Chitiniphilus shinanonensis]|uniref:lysophospholipid acyltransferase family protein n=1 Tax=Chitiniphilus shinanonensis TaxID=553088 RepID=UPI0003A6AEED|nr:lysophospholipid acyltransferase family protein [Chitiniphilus shinanonensis]
MIWIRSALYWLGLIAITLPYAILCLLILPLPPVLRFRIISGWCWSQVQWVRITCGVKYRVEGREHIPAGPAMILSKHQSAWETMALPIIFPPFVYVLKRELFKIPFFGWGLKASSPIGIDRSNRSESQRLVMSQGRDRLAKGFWICIFPEGTRVAAGKRIKYKHGGARLAIALGIPVVPVALNAGEFWPRNSFLKYPGTITVRIGPVIPPEGTPSELGDKVETWIENEMEKISGQGPCHPANQR